MQFLVKNRLPGTLFLEVIDMCICPFRDSFADVVSKAKAGKQSRQVDFRNLMHRQ